MKNQKREKILYISYDGILDPIGDELFGEIEVKLLRIKKQPALKAAEKVAAAKRETREAKVEYQLARNRVDLYESLAPWLVDYTDLSMDELINSIKEENPLPRYVVGNDAAMFLEAKKMKTDI